MAQGPLICRALNPLAFKGMNDSRMELCSIALPEAAVSDTTIADSSCAADKIIYTKNNDASPIAGVSPRSFFN